MKVRLRDAIPFLIGLGVITLVCFADFLGRIPDAFSFFERIEWMTYDWRVRQAVKHSPVAATNLGFVAMSDESIKALLDGETLPYQFGLYWPRQVHARLLRELTAQGAAAVAFDIGFAELRPDHPKVEISPGVLIESDEFFARQLRAAGNVILAAEKGLPPHPLFRTNCWAIGDISAHREPDGILRRVKPYEDVPAWHPLIAEASRVLAWELERAAIKPDRIIFPTPDGKEHSLPLDAEGKFNYLKLYEEVTGQKAAASEVIWSKAITAVERNWQMGILLAAHDLKLDLANAKIEPAHQRIVLSGPNGTKRVIPVDHEGLICIDWSLSPSDRKLTRENIEYLLELDVLREAGKTSALTNRWKGKLVVVGSTATGNDLTDLGSTPLSKQTLLVSQHWNMANSLLTERFIRRSAVWLDFSLIIILGSLASFLTWRLRALTASASVVALAGIYTVLAVIVFVRWRIWLPIVLPVIGALLLAHVSLVTYKVIVEQNERRRVKNIFAKIVSPNIVNELLRAEKLSLSGERRVVTVFFADVRGFTEMTDLGQTRAEAYVKEHKLSARAAEKYHDGQAHEVLDTVNRYLSVIADKVKAHKGTLDKYIGDCVMAFWGAPTPNEKHALCAVQAVIESQRAIFDLNQQRAAENNTREQENKQRAQNGEEPLPMLNLLTLGSGINTGMVTVGLMGSDAHIYNYTVFGREVNLASRLEGVSGRSRIVIGESTFMELQRDDPELARACIELPPVMIKGFRGAMKTYEVPWKQTASPSPAPEAVPTGAAERT